MKDERKEGYNEEAMMMKKEGAWHATLEKYKNPHGYGKPFESFLDEKYKSKHAFIKSVLSIISIAPIDIGRSFH